MFDFLPLKTRTRVLLANQTTATGAEAYLRPTPGVKAINIRAVVKMGNAADLVLSLNSADDAAGTNATAWASNVAIYENGVAQTAAKAHTVDDATGNFIVDFCVDPATVPQDKYVGISYDNSNALNFLEVTMIEDVPYMPTAT
jgi:hypothetical protein